MRALVRMDDEEKANLLGDVLYAKGIESRVDASREGDYLVWVRDEEHLDEANEILERFKENPDDPAYRELRSKAHARRKEKAQEQKASRHRNIDMRKRWQSQKGIGRLTLGLVIVSVAVTLIVGFGKNLEIKRQIVFWLPSILDGEVWRLITPIFLHLGFIHLAFNMYMLVLFGTLVEHRHSPARLAIMVLVIGVLSNAAQAFLVGPNFGGMSGVIYGLFGYAWLRGRMDPTSGIAVRRSTVIILVGWMLLGFAGFMRMANYAHLGGLVVGAAWGAIAALNARSKRR